MFWFCYFSKLIPGSHFYQAVRWFLLFHATKPNDFPLYDLVVIVCLGPHKYELCIVDQIFILFGAINYEHELSEEEHKHYTHVY